MSLIFDLSLQKQQMKYLTAILNDTDAIHILILMILLEKLLERRGTWIEY